MPGPGPEPQCPRLSSSSLPSALGMGPVCSSGGADASWWHRLVFGDGACGVEETLNPGYCLLVCPRYLCWRRYHSSSRMPAEEVSSPPLARSHCCAQEGQTHFPLNEHGAATQLPGPASSDAQVACICCLDVQRPVTEPVRGGLLFLLFPGDLRLPSASPGPVITTGTARPEKQLLIPGGRCGGHRPVLLQSQQWMWGWRGIRDPCLVLSPSEQIGVSTLALSGHLVLPMALKEDWAGDWTHTPQNCKSPVNLKGCSPEHPASLGMYAEPLPPDLDLRQVPAGAEAGLLGISKGCCLSERGCHLERQWPSFHTHVSSTRGQSAYVWISTQQDLYSS